MRSTHFLSPAEVGVYGLMVAGVSYALYVVGLDFYIYSTREVIRLPREQWGLILKSQACLSLILYIVFFPLISIVFIWGFLPLQFLVYFFIILILEHLNQELSRLLIAASHPLVASWILFFRSGLWGVALVVVMFFSVESRALVSVLKAWTLGGAVALVLGCVVLAKMGISGWSQKTDWSWIVKGIKIALPFLVATLALRGIQTIDRYWFESLVGLETLAAYVVFIGMSNALLSFLDAGVFAFLYPILVRAWSERSPKVFQWQLKKMFLQTVLCVVAFGCISALFLPWILVWLEHAVYAQNSDIFFWLILATSIFSMAMIPHYALYAQGKDRHIIASHVVGLVVFLMSVPAFSLVDERLAVPWSLCFSFLVVLAWKALSYLVSTPVEYQIYRHVNKVIKE